MIRATTLVMALVLGAQVSPVTTQKLSSPEKALRFEVTVPGPIDQVWTAFATTDGLKTWLWKEARVDLRPGGDWLVMFPAANGMGASTGGGTIVSFVPRERMAIRALAPEKFPTVRNDRTLALFEFAAVGATSTKVTLTQTGWKTGPEWDAAYDYLAAGNQQLLEQLYTRFKSGPIDWNKIK